MSRLLLREIVMRLTTLFLLLAATLTAQAAPVQLEPLPVILPPPGMVDAASEPQVSIVQRGPDRTEEFRVRGKLYMIKVTPPHGTPYFLIDPIGNGQFQRMNEITPNLMVPLWVLFSF
jgi:hypothetical protein